MHDKKPKGRPRSSSIDDCLLETAIAVLQEKGYVKFSVEEVARRSGITKPTIYLRYKNKALLATSAVAAQWELADIPDNGNTLDDLMEIVWNALAVVLQGPLGIPFIGALFAEEKDHPEALALYTEKIIQPRLDMYKTILQRGIDRGELRPDIDFDLAYEAITGWWYARHLRGLRTDEAYTRHVLAGLVAGWRRP